MNHQIEKFILALAVNYLLTSCTTTTSENLNHKTTHTYQANSKIIVSTSEAESIGKKIWHNECGGTFEGLTSWNKGEYFTSLGIGHFIWYHGKRPGPFDESFPKLINYLALKGVDVPKFTLNKHCPWETRDEFIKSKDSVKMKELRSLLYQTIPLQTEFILLRLENALPKMVAAISGQNRERVVSNFYTLAKTTKGKYALMDYINFKGEGTKKSERYNGKGWGMLQVLEEMNYPKELELASKEFSIAAEKVLTRRVKNAPKNESMWLKGWRNRLKTYL